MQKQNVKQQTKKQTKDYQKPVKIEPVLQTADMKPMAIVPKLYNTIAAWLIFAFTLVIYISTQARTMSFWDSGEFATCMSILGVPHPPGSPFYIVVGRAIVALFGGIFSHAFIAAFLSGLVSAFAVMFTYLFTVKLASMFKIKAWEAMFAGTVAALYTAFSFTFWMNAIEAEVYSGLVFFVNMILWLTMVWVEKSEDFSHQNILLLIVYLFFTGFCVHQTALQIAPAVLFIVSYPLLYAWIKKPGYWAKLIGYPFAIFATYMIFNQIGMSVGIDEMDKWGFALATIVIVAYELRDVFGKRFWLFAIGLTLIGVSSHLYLMVRAANRPFINEGDPRSLTAFIDYVLRRQYGNTNFMVRRARFFTEQFGYHFIRYFNMQWFPEGILAPIIKMKDSIGSFIGGAVVFFMGVGGAVFQLKKNKHSFFYFLSVFLLTSVVMVFVMNLSMGEVRDRDYFFVTAYNMWAVWLGMGSLALISLFKNQKGRMALAVVLLLLPIGNMISQYHVHDRSNEYIALDYGVNFLNSLEENAIIFTNGDNDTFPLWFAQAVEDPHAAVNIYEAEDVSPSENAQAAMKIAMDFKNTELKGIRKDVSIANLSLLNTPWYIKQIRDKEGIQFNMTDEQIDALSIRRFQGQELVVPGTAASGSFRMALENTPPWREREPFYRISDIATMQIIKDNFGHRPIYFAVTCESFIGFDDYLRNEGMVMRLVSEPEKGAVRIDRLINNIDNVYNYRSIEDDSVYKDDNMIRLVLNYGSGFVKAAEHYVAQGEFDKALSYIERAKSYVFEEIKFTEFYSRYYCASGQFEELKEFSRNVIFTHHEGIGIYVSYVLWHMIENYPKQTPQFLELGLTTFNDEDYFAQLSYHFAIENDMEREVREMLNRNRPFVRYDLSIFIDELDKKIGAK
ncbi:MAG: DUF2723 domain-containing protein [Candidatus Cloacimonetes bacterium]|nr:DUF2723 domain-containing protein [Candidatus Cloacimonadota bacterium]